MTMERKIGEIFEANDKWYQCVEATENDNCNACDLQGLCIIMQGKQHVGNCMNWRTDNKRAIFKKLEKWGKPYPNADKLYQLYILPMNIEKLPTHTEGIKLVRFDIVEIEIKQNKEDMEEKKLNLKPFDIQKAKEGKPVCTRDGCKARIICFDSTLKNCPLVVLIEGDTGEYPYVYTAEGKIDEDGKESTFDLMMLPEKKEGWVNIYRDIDDNTPYTENDNIYSSRDKAKESAKMISMKTYIDTIKISWEE